MAGRPCFFVSYRRDDAPRTADRLAERLRSHFDEVFIDVEALAPAGGAGGAIRRVVAKCDFLVAVIGPKWTGAVREQPTGDPEPIGGPMAEHLQMALDLGIPIFPVLVDRTRIPEDIGFPAALAAILDREQIDIRNESFEADAARLITHVHRALASTLAHQGSSHASGPECTGKPKAVGEAPFLSSNGLPPDDGYLFVSYSRLDAVDFVDRLVQRLGREAPHYSVWLDRRELRPGEGWDVQLERAIDHCDALLFVMSNDGVRHSSVCNKEWSRALEGKKLVIPLRLHEDVRAPLMLGSVQFVDFSLDFETGLGELRRHLEWIRSDKGQRRSLELRLMQAERELSRPGQVNTRSIQTEVDDLRRRVGRA